MRGGTSTEAARSSAISSTGSINVAFSLELPDAEPLGAALAATVFFAAAVLGRLRRAAIRSVSASLFTPQPDKNRNADSSRYEGKDEPPVIAHALG
jgi:hypothetical protein